MDTTTLDEIWNRACLKDGGTNPRKGDIALANMIYGHGYIINGGFDHFIDMVDTERIEAIDGYRYFGLQLLVDLLESVSDMTDSELENAASEYVEMDDKLADALRAKVDTDPEDFAPL